MTPASYAMFWWMDDGVRRAGRIEFGDDFVSLAATTPHPAEEERIRFRDLASVGSLDTPGALRELADRLSDRAHAATA